MVTSLTPHPVSCLEVSLPREVCSGLLFKSDQLFQELDEESNIISTSIVKQKDGEVKLPAKGIQKASSGLKTRQTPTLVAIKSNSS